MKKRILPLLLLALNALCFSQNKEPAFTNFIGQDLGAIEQNSDWKVLKRSDGDLNNDGRNDLALILESKDGVSKKDCVDCETLIIKPRIIVILLNEKEVQKVIIQNNKFIARADQGGMIPHLKPELSIERGLLMIHYQFTRARLSYTFKFKQGLLEIVSAENNGVHAATGNFESDYFDFNKGEITVETGNIAQDTSKTKVVKFESKPKTLSEFGEILEWEIVENKFI
jgi:hypothetical protein